MNATACPLTVAALFGVGTTHSVVAGSIPRAYVLHVSWRAVMVSVNDPFTETSPVRVTLPVKTPYAEPEEAASDAPFPPAHPLAATATAASTPIVEARRSAVMLGPRMIQVNGSSRSSIHPGCARCALLEP